MDLKEQVSLINEKYKGLLTFALLCTLFTYLDLVGWLVLGLTAL